MIMRLTMEKSFSILPRVISECRRQQFEFVAVAGGRMQGASLARAFNVHIFEFEAKIFFSISEIHPQLFDCLFFLGPASADTASISLRSK